MASLNKANAIAKVVTDMSGIKTRVIRNQRGNISVWHGGKKQEFNTNQGAYMYVEKLFKAYSAM